MSNSQFHLTSNAINYSWQQLIQRAGVDQQKSASAVDRLLDVRWDYRALDHPPQGSYSVIVVPCGYEALHDLLACVDPKLQWIPVDQLAPQCSQLPFLDPVPVLFWGAGYDDGSKPFAERREDGTIVFYADILAATYFMLTRWEETVVPTRDQHGRFPATASVAYKQGFLGRPIVDEYALILQAWLKTLLPGWEPQPPRFSVKLSHDIDFVRTVPLRRVGADLLKRHNPAQAVRTFRQWVNPGYDPALLGCYELADLSEQCGVHSAFYFMAADRSPLDSGYDPRTKPVRRLIDDLRRRGHEVGFHPGYQTFGNPEQFHIEKQRMDAALGETRYGGRQHYLRFRAPETWRRWEEAGLTYDSTLSYADHEGFRCGTCHPFQPFDIERDRPLDLWEIPLIVMEGTLKQYRNLTPEEGEERILTLAQRCKAVNGVFTLLWHNTSLQGEWAPWAAMYRRVLPQLAALEERTTQIPHSEAT